MRVFWMLCPADGHTCTDRACLRDACRGIAAQPVIAVKLNEPPKPTPVKDDPLTWEVKES